jgi:hypothetical protein
VRSGGTGSAVSIAPASGCTSSGQRGSHSHKWLPHSPQKWRPAGLSYTAARPGSRILA